MELVLRVGTDARLRGVFAVVAASIAFGPTVLSTNAARKRHAREQWWERAQIIIGLMASESARERAAGIKMVSAFARRGEGLEAGDMELLRAMRELLADATIASPERMRFFDKRRTRDSS